MNGAYEAPTHTYTHTHMHGCTRLHAQLLVFPLPFKAIYSKAQNSTRSPQTLTQPHTWSCTLCTTPRQTERTVGTHTDLCTQTFIHGFSCPNTARINTILTRCHTTSHADTQLQVAGSQASHCHITPPATASHCHTQALPHAQTPSPITPQLKAEHTNSQSHPAVTQTHTHLPSTPPAAHTRSHQSLARESRPLPHTRGAGEERGAAKFGHLLS